LISELQIINMKITSAVFCHTWSTFYACFSFYFSLSVSWQINKKNADEFLPVQR